MNTQTSITASAAWDGRRTSVDGARSTARRVSAAGTAFAGVCTLLAAAPFEQLRPVVRLPWQSISNVEAVAAVVVGASVAATWLWGPLPRWRTPLTKPWAALLAAMVLSAALAPNARMNALHMTARLAFAFVVFVLTTSGVTTRARLHKALSIAVGAGLVVAVLAILEYRGVAAVLSWLRAFRSDVTVVGADVRAGGTLQYPTIASMYLEIVFALGLGLLLAAIDERRAAAAGAAGVALVVIGEAITLTFTRAGLLVMIATLAAVGAARAWQRGWDRGVQAVAAIAAVILLLGLASHSSQSFWLRLTTEGQEAWYRAAIQAPGRVALDTGARHKVPVRVTNTGRLVWDSSANPPFHLSYHWIEADSDRVVRFNGARTIFPHPVPPGSTMALDAQVRAPLQPGRYRLVWDVVQEGRLWFSTEPGAITVWSDAEVSGAPPADATTRVEAEGPAPRMLPRPVERPGRGMLWRAAARMLAEHPILGVGPDNFRLTYGSYAGLNDPDPRVHTNNMYIEIAVGAGLLGSIAFLWLTGALAGMLATAIPRVVSRGVSAAIGVGAAAAAVLLHGMVDSFLGFTPTYVLIAITFGFVAACAGGLEHDHDADCI